jgi:Ser/Thr protein kinase RdoA (MazF antagonist)
MDEIATARKFKLQGELINAAMAFLKHVRATEVPPAAIVIPLEGDEVLALGRRESVAGVLGS